MRNCAFWPRAHVRATLRYQLVPALVRRSSPGCPGRVNCANFSSPCGIARPRLSCQFGTMFGPAVFGAKQIGAGARTGLFPRQRIEPDDDKVLAVAIEAANRARAVSHNAPFRGVAWRIIFAQSASGLLRCPNRAKRVRTAIGIRQGPAIEALRIKAKPRRTE
jgi:hypothetical protein